MLAEKLDQSVEVNGAEYRYRQVMMAMMTTVLLPTAGCFAF
jgi:hypothetical protein